MVFWILPLCLQPLIAVAIVLRRQIGGVLIFFLYILFVSARDLVLLFVLSFMHNKRIYSWTYFLTQPLALVLGVAAIYEVLWQLVRPYDTLRLVGIRLFWASVAVAVLGGLVMLRTSDFGRGELWIESLVLVDRSARFVQVGVLIAFILFISHVGMTWKHFSAGIIAGFGVSAGLQLAFFELRSTHLIADDTFQLLNSLAYNIAVLVWATYFFSPRREPTFSSKLPTTDIARLDEILRRYLHQ